MKYQPLNDLIDPEVPAADAPGAEPEPEPGAPEDGYVIGEGGNPVVRLGTEVREGKRRRKARLKRWVKPAAVLSAFLFVGLTVWNISKLAQGRPVPPPPSPFKIKQALYMGAIKVEAYKREHGVTPESAQDAGLGVPYTYSRINSNAYVVAIDTHGSKLEYSSSTPLEKFFGTPQDMLNTEKTQ